MSAEVLKTEYAAIAKGGDTLAWLDTLAEAIDVPGCARVEEHTKFYDRIETVWKADEQ